jgi:hypothetical protein
MNLIKITTDDEKSVKNHMNDVMSFNEGEYEIIVGWDLAKQRGASILKHKINEKTYWTFSPREKRKIFEENLKTFTNDIIVEILTNVKVINLNPLDFNTENEFFVNIKSNINGCYGYLYSERLYVYKDNLIYHIDMGLLRFLGWDILEQIKDLLNIIEQVETPKTLTGVDMKYIPYLDAKKSNIISNIYR